jgi:hypothetical protein
LKPLHEQTLCLELPVHELEDLPAKGCIASGVGTFCASKLQHA